MSTPRHPLGMLCEAVCWMTMPDGGEKVRGRCDFQARGIRDGRYVCLTHHRAKDVEWVDRGLVGKAVW